jgi:SAM-dependent methyltransferase
MPPRAVRELINSLRGLAPRRWMRADWDRRAREDARRFIACATSATDEEFWKSGRRDLDDLVLRDIDLRPSARALEIGCGMGRILGPMSERVERAFGVDISSEMVERAKGALAGRPNVSLFVTDGKLQDFEDASLDFVYSYIVFQHIPSKRAIARYFREAARVLKGSGVFRFQVDGRDRPLTIVADTWLGAWYDAGELKSILRLSDFEIADMWGEGTHYLWVTALRGTRKGRPESGAVAVRRRAWDRSALEALLSRLGEDPAAGSKKILSGRKSLREMAERFLEAGRSMDPESFVRRAYEVILGREADEGGVAFYTKEIAAGIPSSNMVDCLLASTELEDRLRPAERL